MTVVIVASFWVYCKLGLKLRLAIRKSEAHDVITYRDRA